MRTIPYSASKSDLFTPWMHADYFGHGEAATTASFCAEASRLAYCRKQPSLSLDADVIQSVLAGLGFSECSFFNSTATKGGTHCYTAVGTDQASGKRTGVVAFRGTDADDPTDIGDDVDFVLTAWETGGLVQQGFAKALAEIRPALDDAVKSMNVPILFTGHSLGAALATLAASLCKPIAKGSALYTFGSPRVGNSEFVATLDGMEIRRHVDCCDLVARVPLPAMGYSHVGAAYYIDRNGVITLDPPESVMASDRVVAEGDYLLQYAWRSGNVGVRDLADHAPINYVSAVTAAGRS